MTVREAVVATLTVAALLRGRCEDGGAGPDEGVPEAVWGLAGDDAQDGACGPCGLGRVAGDQPVAVADHREGEGAVPGLGHLDHGEGRVVPDSVLVLQRQHPVVSDAADGPRHAHPEKGRRAGRSPGVAVRGAPPALPQVGEDRHATRGTTGAASSRPPTDPVQVRREEERRIEVRPSTVAGGGERRLDAQVVSDRRGHAPNIFEGRRVEAIGEGVVQVLPGVHALYTLARVLSDTRSRRTVDREGAVRSRGRRRRAGSGRPGG